MFKRLLKVSVTMVLICTLLPTSVYAEIGWTAENSLQSTTESTEQVVTGSTEDSNTEKTSEAQSTEKTTEVQNTEESTEVQSTENASEVQTTEKTTEEINNTESTQTPAKDAVAKQPKDVTTATGSATVDATSAQQDELVDETDLNAAVSEHADSDGDADLPEFLQPGEGATGAISGSQTLNPSSATVNDVLSIMKPIICTNEAGTSWNTKGYATVTQNDNNYGISAGILQWNATNALKLLKAIVAKSDANAQEILKNPELYNKIKTDTSWDGTKDSTRFVPTKDQALAIGKLLSSAAGISVQDSWAAEYFSGYITLGLSTYKFTNVSALCYFCDIKNQCGSTTVDRIAKKAIQLAGGDPAYVTLNEMHEAALLDSVAGNYLSRRYLTYNSIATAVSGRGWSYCNNGCYRIPSSTVVTSSDSSAIKWLQWALNSTMQSGLAIDGGYGQQTINAVKAFQSKNGLTADGKAGQQTITKLVQVLDSTNLLTFYSNSISSVVPKVSKVKNTASGVKISWSVVSKANRYKIYRKVNGGSYKSIGTVTNGATTSYTDTTAASGTTYVYRIKAYNDDSKSAYSSGVSILFLQAPTLKKVAVKTTGLKVSWAKTSGASGYYIYRKMNGGSYAKIATVTSGSTASYTDKTVKNKKNYTYTVKAYNNTTASAYISDGISGTYLKAPALKKASATVKGVKVSWSKASGATGYYVYRKTKSGSYSKIGTVTGGSTLTYTDTTAKNKTTYFYTVKAYNKSTASDYVSTGVTILYLKAPVLKSVKGKTTGIKVSWEKVSGASGYAVYRKTGSGSYKKIKDITSGSKLSYTDTTVASKKTYTYTVRAVKGSASSAYNTGISLKWK